MSDDNLSQAEIDSILNGEYAKKGLNTDTFTSVSPDEGVIEANAKETKAPKQPVEEQPEGPEAETEVVEEVPESDVQGEAQPEEEEDVLSTLDEDKRTKIQAKLSAAEEAQKKLENERKAAVGRAAYYQRQHSLMQKALRAEASQTGKVPAYVTPQSPEEWTALEEADPAAAKAVRALIDAETKALRDQYEGRLAPLQHAYDAQQYERHAWIEDQTRLVYENFPDVMEIKQSNEFNQWVEGWSQQIPNFKQVLANTHHAYGTAENPGIVDIINQFNSDLNAYRAQANPEASVSQAPIASTRATAVQEARNNKLNQAPTQQRKPAAVTPKVENLEADLDKAYRAELTRLGIK